MGLNNTDDNDSELNGFEEGFDNGLPEVPPPAGGSTPANKPFMLAIGVIAGLFVIGLIALAGYWFLGRNPGGRTAEAARIEATNNAISMAATGTSVSIAQAATQKAAPTRTLAPTNTPVIVVATNTPAPTNTSAVGGDPAARTATVSAFLTQAAGGAGGAGTGTPVLALTATALPTTGFADEVGLPGLFALGLVLLVVVFVARRLRLSGG